MASNSAVVGFLRVLLSANTAEFDKGIASSVKGLSVFRKGLDDALDGFKSLGGEGGVLSASLGKASAAIDGVVKGVSALGPAGAAAAVGVVAVSAGVVALVAASVEAGVELYKVTKFAADMGDELLTLSNKTGISVEALSELKFVGQQADVPLESITGAIFKLGQTISEGGDKAKKGLGAIGVSFDEIRKLSPDKAFELVIERLHDIPDAGQRAAAGVALFGKGFKEVSQLTQEDMKGLIGQAHDLGLVMSTEFAVAGDRFNDALNAMGAQMDAVKAKIGSQLLPVAIALVETFGTQLTAALNAGGKGAGDLSDIVAKVAVVIGQSLAAIVSVGAQTAKFLVEFFAGSFITSFGLIEFFGEAVTALGKFLTASSYLNPALSSAAKDATEAGKAIEAFGTKGAKATAEVGGNLLRYADAVELAADVTGAALPAAVERVKGEISKTAEEMRKGQAAAGGFGHAIADGTSEAGKAAETAAKAMALLSDQIDAARSHGISASDEIALFGEKAIKASEDARRAGVSIADNVKDVSQAARDLVAKDYYGKIADQARAANLKIIAEEDKRQQRGLEDLLRLATANLEYENNLTDLYRTGTDAQIAEIERKRDAELAALPVETAANKAQLDIRKQQIREHYQWQIDAANGMYHTIGELERAAGVSSIATLREQAEKSRLLYEQMRDSGAFSARDVQKAWEDSVKAQGKAVGGLKGDVLTMYAELGTKLSDTLADMATHWRNWKDDLKKLWSDIAGDFTKMLANMLKQWIEGFLMKLLASLTGARGQFASAFSSIMPAFSLAGGGGGMGGIVPGLPSGGPDVFGGGGGATGALLGKLLGGGALAAGGLYSLFTAKTRGQNILGGAETGAGIGTMILPGIGTAIGAGAGALAGLIKSLFHTGPSQEEVAGRGVVSNFQQDTFANLTDSQRKEAQGAVASGAWVDPTAAGMLIAVRDAYLSIGKTSQQAQDDVKHFWDAEKQGPEATTAAMQPLLDALDQQKQKQADAAASTSETTDAQVKEFDDVKAAIDKLPEGFDDVKAQLLLVLSSVGDATTRITDGPLSNFEDRIETIGSAGMTAARQIQNSFGNITIPPITVPWKSDWTQDGTAGMGPNYTPGRPVPGYARGTPNLDFVDFGAMKNVQLHGREAVVPEGQEAEFAARHGLAGSAVASAARGGAAGGASPTVVILEVDGRQFARAVVPSIPNEARRLGVRVRS
jgi:hypothetical protein